MSIKNTAIYIRVSSDKQVQEGDSIGAQRDALLRYIRERDDLVLAGEYLDDGISGAKYNRDELQRLLDDVRAGKVNLIIFTKLDRWFRSVRHYTATQEILDRYHVGWTAIWETIYDTTSPQGRLIVNQMMSIAQYEAENTGVRVRQVQAYKIANGEVISGTPPHGYRIENKHLIPNDTAQNIVETFKTFDRTSSISRTLIETAGLEDVPRTHHNMKRMLKNPVYIGTYRGNENFCPPLIDRELWDRVQRLLSRNIKINQKHDYIFSGLIRCAECGASMVSYTCSTKWNGRRVFYKRYRCYSRYLRKPPSCPNMKTLGEQQLEEYLVSNINELVGKVVIEYEKRGQDTAGRQRQITVLKKKIDKLKELYLNDLITLDEYKADKTAYLARIEELDSRVDKPIKTDLNALKQLNNSDFKGVYTTLTVEERRRLWRGIIKEVRYGLDKRIEVDFL